VSSTVSFNGRSSLRADNVIECACHEKCYRLNQIIAESLVRVHVRVSGMSRVARCGNMQGAEYSPQTWKRASLASEISELLEDFADPRGSRFSRGLAQRDSGEERTSGVSQYLLCVGKTLRVNRRSRDRYREPPGLPQGIPSLAHCLISPRRLPRS